MHWNEIMHLGDFLFHTFKTIDELNDRYLENNNECFHYASSMHWFMSSCIVVFIRTKD